MLRDRVTTALILAPFLLWIVIWAPSVVRVPVIAIAVLIGAWEWAQFCGWTRIWQGGAFVIFFWLRVVLASQVSTTASGSSAVWTFALLWWGVAFCWLAIAPSRVN